MNKNTTQIPFSKTNPRQIIVIGAIVFILLVGLGFAIVHECGSVQGMGWAVQECSCAGYEWLLYDRTEADGPLRSLCLGFVQSKTCFQYIDGPRVGCDTMKNLP